MCQALFWALRIEKNEIVPALKELSLCQKRTGIQRSVYKINVGKIRGQ